jgi:hypothetical protein
MERIHYGVRTNLLAHRPYCQVIDIIMFMALYGDEPSCKYTFGHPFFSLEGRSPSVGPCIQIDRIVASPTNSAMPCCS